MSFMKKFVVILFILLVSIISKSYAQKKQSKVLIDSLQKELQKATDDTNKVNILNELGNNFYRIKPDQGIKYGEQALELSKQLNFKRGLARANVVLGVNYLSKSKLDTGMTYFSTALDLYEEIDDKKGIVNCYIDMGLVYRLKNKTKDALSKYFAGIRIGREIDYKIGLAGCYSGLGVIYYHQGDNDSAIQMYSQALNIDQAIQDSNGIAGCYGNIGNVFMNHGNYPEALKNFFAALEIEEKTGDKAGQANCYNTIGIIYNIQGDSVEALNNQLMSLKLADELGDKDGMASSYNSIGNIYNTHHNLIEALKNYSSALKIREESGNKRGAAIANYNIGIVYYNQNNFDSALQKYFGAMKVYEGLHMQHELANCYINIGATYGKKMKFDTAEIYVNRGLALAKEIRELESIKIANEYLSDIYLNSGRYEQSLESYKASIAVRDSLINKENTKKIVQIQMQYGFDKKQDSLKLESEKKDLELQKTFELRALRYEYEKKQATAKTEKERQRLEYEHQLKEQKINTKYAQEEAAIKNQNDIAIALASAKRKADLEKAEQTRQKDLAIAAERDKRHQIGYLIGGSTALIASILILNFLRRRKLRKTQDKLTFLARAKLHNLRGNYTTIYSYIHQKKYSVLEDFVDKSSKYIKALLRSWGKEQWTIADEMNLLQFFYDAEFIIQKEVDIISDFSNIDPTTTIFMQDVLTTLLHNSMSYAFPKKHGNCVYKISIKRDKNILRCEISDNGEGSPLEKYRTDDPNDGLNNLEKRVINAFELDSIFPRRKRGIRIEASKESGTVIKFDYPYAKAKNIDRRR